MSTRIIPDSPFGRRLLALGFTFDYWGAGVPQWGAPRPGHGPRALFVIGGEDGDPNPRGSRGPAAFWTFDADGDVESARYFTTAARLIDRLELRARILDELREGERRGYGLALDGLSSRAGGDPATVASELAAMERDGLASCSESTALLAPVWTLQGADGAP